MKRRFVKSVSAVLAGCAALVSAVSFATVANAQEIQLTGPLAGAPAVRQLRLHRAGRFEVAIGSSFTLLDQYLRTAMPGGTLTYHFTDWIGIGVFGGYGLQYNAGLTDELQSKAVTGYNCAARPWTSACQLTAVNLTHGSLVNDQFAHITWMVAPQVVAVRSAARSRSSPPSSSTPTSPSSPALPSSGSRSAATAATTPTGGRCRSRAAIRRASSSRTASPSPPPSASG